ncbi:hypothetical protein T484DRAFT_1847570 [Baffinella frigidus]|nr:hypothetical protein T484DRAFT_1847570 [Cryptophyta sp. CCMP2293]
MRCKEDGKYPLSSGLRPDSGLDCLICAEFSAATAAAVELVSPAVEKPVSAGLFHTCGCDSNGFLHCWGDSAHGQLDHPPGSGVHGQLDHPQGNG